MKRPICYIYSCTCNPLHKGHINIYHYAKTIATKNDLVCFEVSESNATKSNIPDAKTRAERLEQLWIPYLITNGATFVHKSKLIRTNDFSSYSLRHNLDWKYDIKFLVGADCYKEIFNPKHYADSYDIMIDSFKVLEENFCSFLVVERNGIKFEDFLEIPEELFRISEGAKGYTPIDISSTELRTRTGIGFNVK